MADSLQIANTIELLMGDTGPVFSSIPGLENTTFALDDQNNTYSLGEPQPTVDILASLITDGERPQGRRASNRQLSIPIAIISDTRDNLAYACELLFALVDQEQWTLKYTRDGSLTGPMVLDCWRAEPANVTYEPLVEAQFSRQVVINFEALPYGRSDTPNTITFQSPAAGSNPPPPPILIDNFDTLSPGQITAWETSEVSITGNTSITVLTAGEIAKPFYQANLSPALDLTTGGTGLNNVVQFWAGFASKLYYDFWPNHRSEVTFAVKLFDGSGNAINGSTHGLVSQSNNLLQPKWTHVSVRMPSTNTDFDYTDVVRYNITVYNRLEGGNLHLRDSNLFIDSFYALSPSSAVTNVTRGSVYILNGVEGSVHTPVNITATQEPATSVSTQTFTGVGAVGFIPPSGVVGGSVTAIAPGGPAGPNSTNNAGGGGGEWAFKSSVPFTAGVAYTAYAPAAVAPLQTAPFAGTWTACGTFSSTGAVTSATALFSASVAVGMTVLVQAVMAQAPQVFGGNITATDDAGNGTYTFLGGSSAPDGTFTALFAAFNIVNAITTSNHFTVGISPAATTGVTVKVAYCQGMLSMMPFKSAIGTSQSPYVSSAEAGWLDTVHSLVPENDLDPTYWALANTSLALSTAAPVNGISPSALALTTTASSGTASITSGLIPTNDSTNLILDLLANLSSASSKAVTISWSWFNNAQTLLSSSSETVTYTANSWLWAHNLSGWNSSITPPSGAAYIQYKISWTSTATGDTLYMALLGPRPVTNDNPQYIATVANNSGLNLSSAPPGWTLISSGTGANGLCFDTYFIRSSGVGGMAFGIVNGYSASIPWAVLITKLTDSAGFAGILGDNGVYCYAHGGQPAAATSLTAGLGGLGSSADVHNPGGNGGVGAGVTGGGGGSSGGSGGTTTVDDTDPTMTFWNASAPPLQITPDFGIASASQEFTHGSVTTNNYNGFITVDPQMTQSDTIIVLVVSTIQGTIPAESLQDSNGNTYTFIGATPFASSDWRADYFCANAKGQGNGKLKMLSIGDYFWLDPKNTSQGNYAIMGYVFKGGKNFQGVGHGANGEFDANFNSTTGTGTISGINTAPNGHFGVIVELDGVQTAFNTANAKQLQVGNTQNPNNLDPSGLIAGQTWPAAGLMQAFWKDADSNGSGSSTALSFIRPTSGVFSVLFTTFHQDTSSWNTSPSVRYHNTTHHYTSEPGKHARIAVSAPQIQILGKKGVDQGIMLVSLDNGPWQSVDNYRSADQYQTVLYDTGRISNTAHTIDIISTGLHNQSSSGTYIDLDGYNVVSAGAGLNASGSTGGVAVTGGGAGANGATTTANGSQGGTPGGGGSGGDGSGKTGGKGGPAQVQISYTGNQTAFKTLVLHRPYIDGSKTLMPYIACATQAVPTSDMITGIWANVPPRFKGTYSIVVVGTFNTPSASRTLTCTVTEYEDDPAGILPGSTSVQTTSRTFTPNDPAPNGAPNGMITIGELTLPNKDIPPENINAVYNVSISSTNSSDTIQDVLLLDTMGQTVTINETIPYPAFYVDEPTPDSDIGRIMGSQFDRGFAISVLDQAFPTGGPMTIEPGDNILFAYCVEGAPALVAKYFPRYFIDRTPS